MSLLPKGWGKPILGWGMKSEEGDNLAPIIWCWGASTTPAQLVLWDDAGWRVITRSSGHTETNWSHGHSTCCMMNLEKPGVTFL